MARPRDTERKDRWYFRKDHPYYNYGYVFERGGKSFVFIKPNNHRKRLRKSLDIPFAAKNKAIALNALETMIVEHNQPVNKLKEGIISVYGLFEAYANVKFPNASTNLQYKYTSGFQKIFPEDISIENLGAVTVFIETRITDLQAQYHNNYVRKMLQFVATIFNYHVKRGVLQYNPLFKELYPDEVTAKKEVYTKNDINNIYNHFIQNNKEELAYLIEFVAITGCRIDEAIKAKWYDVNDDILIIHGKGNRDREFPINVFEDMPLLLEKIKYLKKNNVNNKIFSWIASEKPRKHLRNAVKELNITVTGFHAIRRFRENQLANELDLPPRIVAALLGHTERIQKKHYLKELSGIQIEKLLQK